MKGTDSLKKIPKNFWIIGIAIVGAIAMIVVFSRWGRN